jgi:predicted alpha/beta hydrolase
LVVSKPVDGAAESVLIDAKGAQLRGYVFSSGTAPARAIVIHPATGVPQRFYAKFARWLAETHSAAVLTYDYRDLGESARGTMTDARSTMSDWGVYDQSAALDLLCERYPGSAVWVIGHSLGGMFLAWHDKAERIERVITVASGKANYLRHPPTYLPLVWAFWFALGPVTTKIFGYLPGKYSGIGADLPATVFWQWRRWCLSPKFYELDWGKTMPVPDLKRVKADITMISLTDDQMMPASSVRLLADLYPAARVTHRDLAPEAAGLQRIGHLHLFSERCKSAWPLIMDESGKPVREAA